MFFKMHNETFILIDGAYLSFISKFFGKGKPLKFKIEEFSKKLCSSSGMTCKEISYYTAPPYQNPKPTKEENARKGNYDKFIKKLTSASPKINVREGRCQKDGDGHFHQKGVDTLLTMDLFRIAQQKKVNQIVIITADTDFVPIIKEIKKEFGIRVVLAYFTDRRRGSAFSMSNHLWNACDKKILIKKEFFL